nr:MAG TPA: putative terminase small subunit [Caudoviricetes sp.]
MDEDLIKSLLKRAKGYRYNEVQEEYSVKEDGEFVLTKKKIVKKYCPPDSSAFRTYLDIANEQTTASMSDEQLEKEKQKLIEQIKDELRKESE